MAKILLVNGSPNEHGCTATALGEIADTLQKNGVEAEILWLGKKPMTDCIACFNCQTNGKCVFSDQVNEIGSRIDEYDGFVFGSPVYYGGPTGRLTSFMDRLFFSIPDEKKFAGKLAASVVSCRRGGATSAFERLNQYYLMENMIVVGSQYWNQVHGFTPDDVRKDEEGLQTMRTLGQNMAWVLKSIETGKKNNVCPPEYEAKKSTNFI